jgi:uncharacterized delta-60 repeat protein
VAQPDGKVVVAGMVPNDIAGNDVGVWRLTADGRLDPSFGRGDGMVSFGATATTDEAYGVAVDGQGRILVAGLTGSGDVDMLVLRLTPTGDLDGTFNNGQPFFVVDTPGVDVAHAVAVQRDGKVLLSGLYDGVGGSVVRIRPGTPDTPQARLDTAGFGGGDGVAEVPGGVAAGGTDVAVERGGDIFVLGRVPAAGGPAGTMEATVVRLTTAGEVDGTFGSATGAHVHNDDINVEPRALSLLPRGGVVVVASNSSQSVVAKFRRGGAPDAGMGPGGVKTFAKGSSEDLQSIAVQPDGRIIAVGHFDDANGDPHSVLYRLLGDLQAPMCGGRTATVTGTKAADILVGTRRVDVIAGLGGGDTITGLGKGDIACAGAGNDHLKGGRGGDQFYGQTGRDTLSGGEGRDMLIGGPGRDKLKGGAGHDTLQQ